MKTNNTSRLLDTVARDFIPEDFNLLPQITSEYKMNRGKPRMKGIKWVASAFAGLLVVFLVLAFVPGVATAMQRMLGFIPGVGIIETSTPIRVLAEPVSSTREGVTVSVKEAILTGDRTVITYEVYGVPSTARPDREDVIGCALSEYLRLPDGSTIGLDNAGTSFQGRGLPPVPADVNEFTFVVPCIRETMPGTVPENWEFDLRFVPAPVDFPVFSVTDVTPAMAPGVPSISPQPQDVVVKRVIETADGYILIGDIVPRVSDGTWARITGAARITDATGKEIFYTTRNDIDLSHDGNLGLSGYAWAFEIQGSGIVFPITISFPGMSVQEADPKASVEFDWDAGANPQLGQEWVLNKDFQIAGHSIRLVSITATQHGSSSYGYEFSFTAGAEVTELQVAISGYTPNGGGGGNSDGTFSVGLSYEELPRGLLRIVLSHLIVITGQKTWIGTWQPENTSSTMPIYGFTLKADSTIRLNDWVYLIGHSEWTDDRIMDITPVQDSLTIVDTAGNEIPGESSTITIAGSTDANPNSWVVRVRENSFTGALTMRVGEIDVRFRNPVSYTLDLRPFGFDLSNARPGYWKTGLSPIEVPGFLVNVSGARYVLDGETGGFEITMIADPVIQCIEFQVVSGITGGSGVPKTGCRRDKDTGHLISSFLTDGQISFPVYLSTSDSQLSGFWETSWTPLS